MLSFEELTEEMCQSVSSMEPADGDLEDISLTEKIPIMVVMKALGLNNDKLVQMLELDPLPEEKITAKEIIGNDP
ncbi:RNA polymerase Rpb2, domain [Trema orientale]|uniref:RNA polymerase Rpb2, domain n=1 Tax=Trema orientale TaxID=63057 RepID=A0A2P5DJ22_TREOI|nr:RNA polymerase Rpb2, domain [Trema orientale]